MLPSDRWKAEDFYPHRLKSGRVAYRQEPPLEFVRFVGDVNRLFTHRRGITLLALGQRGSVESVPSRSE